jgi:hypothetical protein
MADRIPVVADVPADEPGFGFETYVEALAAAIRGGEPPQFTVGLYGPWGSGKSSLLNGLQRELERDGTAIPVFFDAWRYERTEHIVVPLLHRVYEVVARLDDARLAGQLRRALAALVFSVNFKVAGVGVDAKKIQENWTSGGPTALDEAFGRPFEEMRKVPEVLDGRRIVVLIDDLDRCSPNSVVQVLEAINVVMDVPGFIFVLALDYDLLVRAVNQRYPHVSGHSFIEKIVQLPFRVPQFAFDTPHALVELLPDFGSGDALATAFLEIAHAGLAGNPRQVKRLFNTYLVLARVLKVRGERGHALLLALLGLQLAWPQEYREFHSAVFANESEEWLTTASDASDRRLARYVKHILRERCDDLFVLQTTLRLSTVVASVDPVPAEHELVDAQADPEDTRARLLRALLTAGFDEIDREGGSRFFARAAAPYFGVEMTDTMAWVRRRRSPREKWTLVGQFFLDTDGLGRLLEVIQERV